jgi:hypothetical protein
MNAYLDNLVAYHMDGPVEDSVQLEIRASRRYGDTVIDKEFCAHVRAYHDRMKDDGRAQPEEQLEIIRIAQPMVGDLGYIGSRWLLDVAEENGMRLRDVNSLYQRWQRITDRRERSRRINMAVDVYIKPGYLSPPIEDSSKMEEETAEELPA